MQEEFENTVRERMHTFGIQPSHEVWGEIEAVLNKKKHRRVFVGWWILLGLVVLGGGVLYYQKDSISREGLNQHPIIIADTASNTHIAKNLAPATTEIGVPSPPTNKTISPDDDRQAQQNQTAVTDHAVAGRNNLTAKKGNPASTSKTAFLAKTRMPTIITSGAGADKITTGTNTQVEQLTQAVAATTNKQTPTVNNEVALAKVPTQAAQTNNDTTSGNAVVLHDSALPELATTKPFTTTTVANKPAIAPQKKHAWYVTFSAGTTRTVSFGQFNGTPPGNTCLLYTSPSPRD